MRKNNKKNGIALLATIISIAVLLLVSGGYFTILASNTGLIKSGGESIQAQYFAQLEADTIKMLPYDEVDDITQDVWQDFDVDQHWQYKVNIGQEENIGDSDNTMKIASIAVKKHDDTMSRYSLEVPLSSQGSNILPVGTILPYIGNLSKIPHGWFLCDGNNNTPDLRNRFLEGSIDSPKIFKAAGIPNITGTFSADQYANWIHKSSGAFKFEYFFAAGDEGTGSNDVALFSFDASRCSSIYGNSNTVQPKSYMVYYIIRMM